jgi:hypothetical protein
MVTQTSASLFLFNVSHHFFVISHHPGRRSFSISIIRNGRQFNMMRCKSGFACMGLTYYIQKRIIFLIRRLQTMFIPQFLQVQGRAQSIEEGQTDDRQSTYEAKQQPGRAHYLGIHTCGAQRFLLLLSGWIRAPCTFTRNYRICTG